MSGRMYPRSEFPVEKPRAIVRSDGSVNRGALKSLFSAVGCPLANVEVAVAVIKAGGRDHALALGMLAYYAQDLSVEGVERTAAALIDIVKRAHAKKHPRGKWAEEFAAEREGRASRWGTPEFHRMGS